MNFACTIIDMDKKQPQVMLKAKQTMGQPLTHFAMVELQALEGLGMLVRSHPKAAELMLTLIRQMPPGSGGVVVCGRQAMREMLDCSMPTVERALRVLIDGGWVQRMRIGSAHALAINHRVAWVGSRGNIQHAVFSATVIASRTEQDDMGLNPPPARNVPILAPGEHALAVGPGAEPPSQPELDGVPPVVAIQSRQVELESRGQLRLKGIDPDTGEILLSGPEAHSKAPSKRRGRG